jgi:HNH endonuclease
MERELGRELYRGENVHHRNGNRADNRPENLELWVTFQPSGQRPADLVAYAKEILARYDVDRRETA